MTAAAIEVRGVGKQYRLGERAAYGSLRDSLAEGAAALSRRLGRGGVRARAGSDLLWALDAVSFQVEEGEVLGIVGRNGAGKSTLLKILSRVTEPTTGVAITRGRVGSLLEVGTGFHPELTGRENIYLHGAILGMSRREVADKFDEIVDFAQLEPFLDTPVKRYSSGMYVRLAFAVAAHVEPDILLVDEVLAVGDTNFQRKCLERMRSAGREGRTILFVSHNLAAVRAIASRGIALDGGRIVAEGEIGSVVDAYLGSAAAEGDAPAARRETPGFVVESVSIRSTIGASIKTFDPVEVEVTFVPKEDVHDPGLYVGITTGDHQRVAGLDFRDLEFAPPLRAGQRCMLGFVIEELPLHRGRYALELHLKDLLGPRIEEVPGRYAFEVVETPLYRGRSADEWDGQLALRAHPRVSVDSGDS